MVVKELMNGDPLFGTFNVLIFIFLIFFIIYVLKKKITFKLQRLICIFYDLLNSIPSYLNVINFK